MTKQTTIHEWVHDGRPELTYSGHPAPPGPWWDEPDKIQWVDEETDLDCLILRNHFGALCGYVGVPKSHPWHGDPYQDHDWSEDGQNTVNVHGGLTFTGSCMEEAPEGYGVCHIPEPGRPDDVWWFGFDCGHAFDLSPGTLGWEIANGFLHRVDGLPEDTYRDVAYVKTEVAHLARQLKAVA